MIACHGQFLTSMLWRYLIPVYCITLPAVKKGLAFCCIDWTRYTPALTSSTGAILLVYHIEPSISMQGSKHI